MKFKNDLLASKFDQILFFMNELIRADFFFLTESKGKNLGSFLMEEKNQIQNIPLKNKKIREIEEKYDYLHKIVSEIN